MMPYNLVLIRHGESEGNIAVESSKNGDDRYYTDTFLHTPGSQWRLSEHGVTQAQVMGGWLNREFSEGFDRYYVSPYVRTRETAGHLGLDKAQWIMNRSLRERDWGDIGSLPRSELYSRSELRENLKWMKHDPLYWVPPGGESIAMVAENRVRNVLDTLHRECSEKNVIAATHGEFMWSTRLVLERWSDEEYVRNEADHAMKIRNCMVLHYTRVNPHPGPRRVSDRLSWLRIAHPIQDSAGGWRISVSKWQRFEHKPLTNEELLESLSEVPSIISEVPPLD